MRAVVQRVSHCTVTVENRFLGSLDNGLLVYLGVSRNDTEDDITYVAEKVMHLRIFKDGEGKMNLSISEKKGYDFMVVSQFTLFGDTRKGRRPSYSLAAGPSKAESYYLLFIEHLTRCGFHPASGEFGAMMEVSYTNTGPVTLLIDSERMF